MNIGQIIRGFLGEAGTADAKMLELKVGQVVKGLVLQLFNDQEALVNINGIHVRAKLETPLKQGQATLLQVQPESTQGKMILKPLSSSVIQIAEQSLPELVKSFDLKDRPANRQLVQQLHQAGIPLTKANVRQFDSIINHIPTNVSSEEWIQAAVDVVKRGLPLKQETVAAVRQVVFGKPLHETLQQLAISVTDLLNDGEGGSEHTRQELTKLKEVLTEIRAFSKQLIRLDHNETNRRTLVDKPLEPSNTGNVRLPKALGVEHEQQVLKSAGWPEVIKPSVSESTKTPQPQPQAQPQPPPQRQPQISAAEERQDLTKQQQVSTEIRPSSFDPGNRGIVRLLRALGLEHEQQVLKFTEQPEAIKPSESLKSLLLQLRAAEELSPALKEQIQQTVQHITGQQLMMSSDRTAVFMHMSIFLPLFQADNSRTAAVHIQAQRGKRGQIDAGNCRILFDLHMEWLGSTLVDVHVIKDRVSLSVYNDHPSITGLLETYRAEITKGLEQVGFQVLSLKNAPYPKKSEAQEDIQSTDVKDPLLLKPSFKTYKGVDIRI